MEKNGEKIKARERVYRQTPTARAAKAERKVRRKRIISDHRKFLSEEHKIQIRDIYLEARKLRDKGIDVHVDHITPLNGGLVSGLHVPWNLQILPATVNLKKSNNF